MACMCGDLYCNSCGPAQGNHKCICGLWTIDGGCKTPEACAEAIRRENQAWEDFYRQEENLEAAIALTRGRIFCGEPYCRDTSHVHLGDYYKGIHLWTLDFGR